MTKIEITTSEDLSQEDLDQVTRIFEALIRTGGLLRMKNGSTQIHFDDKGKFRRIKFEYFPWVERFN